MKEEKVIKSLKITSIVFGLILGILSIFLVLNESFALFTSNTDKRTYSFKTHKLPMLTTGKNFQTILKDAGYKEKITKIVFESNKDLTTVDTSIDSFDVSYKQNGAVIGYMTLDQLESDRYILHIATNDSIVYANSSSSNLFDGSQYSTYGGVFRNLSSIENINILDTSNVKEMSSMFYGCSGLTSLDVSHFVTNSVTSMQGMFNGCSGLTSLDLSHFNTSNVNTMNSMFELCSNLTSLDLSSFDTSNVTNIADMFRDCTELVNLDVAHFNTSNVTDMRWLFHGCSGLTSLDVTHFDTSNVTDMQNMFYECSSLTSLDVTHFNTSNVTNMSWMFSGCSGLTSLDVTHFNTSNVTNMRNMFSGCSSLTTINVLNFNTSNVTNMSGMFHSCSSMTLIDLSNFDTSNVVGNNADSVVNSGTANMFSNCRNLTEIKLNNAELGQVLEYSEMFGINNYNSLYIYLKDTQTNRNFMNNNFSNYRNITWV